MKTTVEISPVKVDDASEIQDVLYRASIGMYQMHGYDLPEIDAHFSTRNSEENISKARRVIESLSSNEMYMVAKYDNHVVGICYAEKEKDRNVLHALYVMPEFQNMGVGRELWNSVRDWLSDNDVYLDVLNMNAKAVGFYESLGFIPTRREIVRPGLTHNSELRDIEMVLKQ